MLDNCVSRCKQRAIRSLVRAASRLLGSPLAIPAQDSETLLWPAALVEILQYLQRSDLAFCLWPIDDGAQRLNPCHQRGRGSGIEHLLVHSMRMSAHRHRTSLLDRLLHHAVVVDTSGDSWRMKEARTQTSKRDAQN